MPTQQQKILVTSALPYASGPIHMGHLVGYIQADIWVRFQKMIGNDCVYLCASDAHGTPIMLKAQAEDISPEQLVERFRAEHARDFAAFFVEFDNYYTTHSDENRQLVEQIYARLNAKDLIATRVIEQAYDAKAGMFLPDRYVRGTCPYCGAEDQAGDNCEVCSRTYSPSEVVDPKSVITQTTPVQKASEHYFFRLGEFEESLRKWISAGHVDPGVARKLEEWFAAGLQDWDISRDAPYFGFRIPDTEDKYFYVWLDAPVGYMASLANLGARDGNDFDVDTFFAADSDADLYHFIGKDIVYFHTLFWPAVLEGADFRKPTGVFAHGFLTVNGEKMSKSRGTFITAATYLENLDPEFLRYYYAFKLGPAIEDIDLNLEDFVARTNSDLIGKFVNIASRCSGFITKRFEGRLAETLDDPGLYDEFVQAGTRVADFYQRREFARAMREIMKLADRANQYVDEHKPWHLIKEEQNLQQVQRICTQGLNFFRVLATYLKPVLPRVTQSAEQFLAHGELDWNSPTQPLLDTNINPFKPLMTRIEQQDVANMVDASRENLPASKSSDAADTID